MIPGMNLERTLADLASDPFLGVDLAELNLHLAADVYPALDISAFLGRLDALADALAPRLTTDDLEAKTAELTHYLFEECGFAGNADEYYDPRNSYLNEVLDRRLGIPLSLSLLAIAVGERCGLTVVGVGLPGHFVAKTLEGDDEVLFDPFHGGQVLDYPACEQLVTAVTGRPFHAHDDSVAATPPGLICQRMLNNLKAVYLKAGDFAHAAAVIRRLTQLVPDDPTQRRDLGVTLVKAGQPGQALPHLQAYLTAEPAADDTDTVRTFWKEARKQIAAWN
jgi:regulator of sirC expression with transglutaminase-like and TPR domain